MQFFPLNQENVSWKKPALECQCFPHLSIWDAAEGQSREIFPLQECVASRNKYSYYIQIY